jgi:hypothetical protein
MAKKIKKDVEISLVTASLTDGPEGRLLKMRNLLTVDLIWPRVGIARKAAAREILFRKGQADFQTEPWAKRLMLREEIESHSALAVSVTEPVTIQKLRRFARLTAKYALRMGADFVEKSMVGYADIASAPMDALSAMVGEKDAPEVIAQGVVDIASLPGDGEERLVTVPLFRPRTEKIKGEIVLSIKG